MSVFFYEYGQDTLCSEKDQLSYGPMEDVMSTVDDPNILLEILAHHSSYMKNKPLENQKV